jgi:hypothetical protein
VPEAAQSGLADLLTCRSEAPRPPVTGALAARAVTPAALRVRVTRLRVRVRAIAGAAGHELSTLEHLELLWWFTRCAPALRRP